MANVVIVFVLVLFAFGVSFGILHSYPAAAIVTMVVALWTTGLMAWIRRHPVRWSVGTRVWIALGFAVGCAGLGVASLVVDREVWPTGILCLTAAAASAISAATMRESRGREIE